MKRFPTRTLVLMVLTLLAFGWMYWQTHNNPPPRHEPSERRDSIRIVALPADGGPDAIGRALRDAMDATNFPSLGGDP